MRVNNLPVKSLERYSERSGSFEYQNIQSSLENVGPPPEDADGGPSLVDDD